MVFLPKENLCTLFNGRGFTPKILLVNLFSIIYYHTISLALCWATFIANTFPIMFTVWNKSKKHQIGQTGACFVTSYKKRSYLAKWELFYSVLGGGMTRGPIKR